MLFYRVENANCTGMYRFSDDDDATLDDMVFEDEDYNPRRHPLPCQDSLLLKGLGKKWPDFFGHDAMNFQGNHHFAFKSLEQLKFWLYRQEWREWLEQRGFEIVVYEAEGVYGDTQAVFDIHTATPKEFHKLTEI